MSSQQTQDDRSRQDQARRDQARQDQGRERGPARFRLPEEQREPLSVWRMLGAGVLLVAIVVGVPLALLLLDAAPPLPRGLPGRDDLTRPLTTGAIITVLTAVVWLAWLQFVVCTLVETLSVLRGRGLPRPVPLSGPSQQLARALVGTLLVGASFLGGSMPSAAAPVAAPAPTEVAGSTQVGAVVPADTVVGGTPDVRRADGSIDLGESSERSADQRVARHAGVPADMKDVIGKKVYVVKPPQGHYHDNLWDIAENHLGNGRRWHEIFALNKDRPQPDGEQLELGRLIQPGWVLVMPGDASGVERVQAAPRPAAPGAGGPTQSDHRDSGAALTPLVEEASPRSDLPRDLVGGGVLAASLLLALAAERRRRRGRRSATDALEAEVALRVGADEDRARLLDRGLRGLLVTCTTEQRALPSVFAASVGDDHLDLMLAPPSTDAPAPWTPVDEGRVWRLAATAPEPAELGPAPFPGLVCVGRELDGRDLFLDVESVGGVVSVQGAEPQASEVVSALAVQLATSPWSDDQLVRGFHLSEVLADLAGDRLVLVDDLAPMLEELERTEPQRSAQEVLTGRLARRPGVRPQYAVLGSAPDAALAERLSAVAATGSRGFGVVATGHVPGTRWELEVDEAGTLKIPLLGREVEAVRLTAASAELVTRLLEDARTEALPSRDARVAVPAAPRTGDDGRWSAAAVRVGVLGALDLRTPGAPLDPTRTALATELATYLALQATPVHPNVLAASVWPRGVTAEVRDATIARVREWLGTDAEGNHHLRSDDDGRLSLAADVSVDWHAFCELAQRARRAGAREERELLRRALHLVRGPFVEDRPSGRYAWLARTRIETTIEDVVVDTAHRLAELCMLDDDPAGAAASARAGLRLHPGSQLLWRDLLRAEHHGPGGPDAAGVAAAALTETLGRRGAHLEAETDALLEELLPARRTASQGA